MCFESEWFISLLSKAKVCVFVFVCVRAGMGTKVHSESLLPGRYHHSMRDLNNDSNGCSRLPFLNNDQSYKDVVRRTMLQHEAVFKSQVSLLVLFFVVDYMFAHSHL